jgi:hypothetical protein
MFTAKDVRKKLQEINLCEGLDEWIENTLILNFLGSDLTEIPTTAIKWREKEFVSSMTQRGFHVMRWCEDRPCGGCYYRISLPPVGE